MTLPKGIASVHPVFYTSLLRPDSNNPLPRQHVQPQGPIIIEDENSSSHEEYEVEEILNSRYSYGFLEYKVKWKGHPIELRKWYRANLFQNTPEVIRDFHNKYLSKPALRLDRLRIRQSELNERVNVRNQV